MTYSVMVKGISKEDRKLKPEVTLWIQGNEIFFTIPDTDFWNAVASYVPEARKDEDKWRAPLDISTIQQLKLLFPTKIKLGPGVGEWYLKNRKTKQTETPVLPTGLYPYQVVGARFAAERKNVLILDDPGVGKTAQAIAAAETIPNHKTLVICPGMLKWNWEKELHTWAGTKESSVVDGDKISRDRIIKFFSSGYLVIGLETLRLHPELGYMEWDWVIIDEIHRLKDGVAKQTRAAKLIPSDGKIGLSGTIVINELGDLWSPLNFIAPDRFPDYKHFVDYYNNDPSGIHHAQLETILAPYVIRRTRDQVLPNLPPLVFQDLPVQMSPQQSHLYMAMKTSLRASWKGRSVTALEVLTQMTRLRQLALSPLILGFSEPGSKLELLREILEDSKERTVVFSTFAEGIRQAGQYLKNNGINVLVMTGKTPDKERESIQEYYNIREGTVLLTTIQLSGQGLNFQAGHRAIFLDLPWAPSYRDQAIDRLYRNGQEKSVHVMTLSSIGADERIQRILYNKENHLRPIQAAMTIALEEELLQESQVAKINSENITFVPGPNIVEID